MRIRHCGICEISNITTVTCKENLWTLVLEAPLLFRHCVVCNSAAVDEVKYRTTWSGVDGRPFTRTNTVPVDDRANTANCAVIPPVVKDCETCCLAMRDERTLKELE
jgi:hypothetical protein